MNAIYKQYLFGKHYLVGDGNVANTMMDTFATLFTLAKKFGIRIVRGAKYARPDMIKETAFMLGEYVPEPFYRGFPDSVRQLSPDQLRFDQMYHYFCTYICGDFDGEADHSLFEENFERTAFKERTEPKLFSIINEGEATELVMKEAESLLKNSRPLSVSDYDFVRQAFADFSEKILPDKIPCKKTAIQLLYDTKDMRFANYIALTDVIKLVEYIQYTRYGSEKLNKLNLKNQDRKLITRVLDKLFAESSSDDHVDLFEKRQIWKGLLHHLHYKTNDPMIKLLISILRDSDVPNSSSMSWFELYMRVGQPENAADFLVLRKGTSALIRNLDYILSRCKTEEQVKEVLACLIQ